MAQPASEPFFGHTMPVAKTSPSREDAKVSGVKPSPVNGGAFALSPMNTLETQEVSSPHPAHCRSPIAPPPNGSTCVTPMPPGSAKALFHCLPS